MDKTAKKTWDLSIEHGKWAQPNPTRVASNCRGTQIQIHLGAEGALTSRCSGLGPVFPIPKTWDGPRWVRKRPGYKVWSYCCCGIPRWVARESETDQPDGAGGVARESRFVVVVVVVLKSCSQDSITEAAADLYAIRWLDGCFGWGWVGIESGVYIRRFGDGGDGGTERGREINMRRHRTLLVHHSITWHRLWRWRLDLALCRVRWAERE
ncbi:hypothetical protein G7046_g4258 [Stylonectria norvegica]|nr:hypothetical protein G7046_g4258 [Stylonectria norvegica]